MNKINSKSSHLSTLSRDVKPTTAAERLEGRGPWAGVRWGQGSAGGRALLFPGSGTEI